MAGYAPERALVTVPLRWGWSNVERVLARFEADHGPALTVTVREVLDGISLCPLERRPGERNLSGPSALLRYVESDGVRVEFVVAEPVARSQLQLVAVTVCPDGFVAAV